MTVSVISAAVAFRKLVGKVDVDLLSGGDCAEVAEELARVEKTCAAVRAMAAARAADCGAHRARGFGDAGGWMAGITGSSRQQAKSELETGERLGACPETKDAALGGDLSLGQAGEIAKTEKEKPGSESDLVRKAKTSTRQQLADACRKRRQRESTTMSWPESSGRCVPCAPGPTATAWSAGSSGSSPWWVFL